MPPSARLDDLRHGLSKQRCFSQWSQGDEPDAVGKTRAVGMVKCTPALDGQARFADAARTDEGDETMASDMRLNLVERRAAADE